MIKEIHSDLEPMPREGLKQHLKDVLNCKKLVQSALMFSLNTSWKAIVIV